MIMKSATTAVVAILVATLGLAGCTASEPEGQSQSAEPTDEPTETAEPEPQVPANGETLTTQEQIDAAKAAGLDAYELADGTVIAVDPTQPLPQPVIDEGTANIQSFYDPENTNLDKMSAAAQAVDGQTAKNVIFVFPTYGSKDGVTWEPLYTCTIAYAEKMGGFPGSQRDPQVLVSFIEQWIAQQANPETYQVVLVPLS